VFQPIARRDFGTSGVRRGGSLPNGRSEDCISCKDGRRTVPLASGGNFGEKYVQLQVGVDDVVETLQEDAVDTEAGEDPRCCWCHPVYTPREACPAKPVIVSIWYTGRGVR